MPKKSNGSAGRKSSNGKARKPAARGAKRNTAIPKAPPRKVGASATAAPSMPARATQPAQQSAHRPPQQLQPQARSQSLPNVSGEITHDMIARRAYEIYLSGTGGSEFDNWCRAERELRDRR
jgi:hypothetical protein